MLSGGIEWISVDLNGTEAGVAVRRGGSGMLKCMLSVITTTRTAQAPMGLPAQQIP